MQILRIEIILESLNLYSNLILFDGQGNFHAIIVEFFQAMDVELKEYEITHNIHIR